MTKIVAFTVAAALLSGTLLTACDSATGGGPKKVVVNERICQSGSFLRLTVNKEHHLVVDGHGGPQLKQLSLRLADFPMQIKGDIPLNSTIGDPLSTIVLVAPADEEDSVNLVPTNTGTYSARCGLTYNEQIQAKDLAIQVVP
jgi:hypothetical protein